MVREWATTRGVAELEIGAWWAEEMRGGPGYRAMEVEAVRRHHRHDPTDRQCSSALVRHIKAPVNLVWSLVRSFDQPQRYKPFVSRCVVRGDLEIGSLREVNVKTGLPATTSTERLEMLDDDEHVLVFKIIGGDHRLRGWITQEFIHDSHPLYVMWSTGLMILTICM